MSYLNQAPFAAGVTDRRTLLRAAAFVPFAAGSGFAAHAQAADPLTIATRAGTVRGRAGDHCRVFTGIPYGRARRFAPPVAAARWTGVLDATNPANIAPQVTAPGSPPREAVQSEDCLQLNVWVPEGPGPFPVLFYIHGGGNESGWSGEPGTAGDRFAQDGVICVTANYRVGALGFLELGGLLGAGYRGSACNGIRDLVLALHWVRANIVAFGGDPRRVTIAGESAGGKNVGSLLGTPAADGLYAQAILFSGGGETVYSRDEAQAFAHSYAAIFGGDARGLIDAPIARILEVQAKARAGWPQNFPYRPVVDGAFMPMTPIARIRSGKAPRVAMLIGTNADESRLFVPPDRAAQPIAPQSVSNVPMARIAELDAAYARAFPDLSVAERHWRLLTAEEYAMPCLRIAAAHAARGARVWRYRLTYPAPSGPFAGHTPHAMDLAFTFDHLTLPGMSRFFGLSAKDEPMAERMHGAVRSFVADGHPQAAGLPAWPRYAAPARATMVLGTESALVSDPDVAERAIWHE